MRAGLGNVKELRTVLETVEKGFVCGLPEAGPFEDIDDYYRRGQIARNLTFHSYKPEGLKTEVFVPVDETDYCRASIDDAVRALEQTPDPDLIDELFLVDHVHGMEPWLMQTEGARIAGESNTYGLVILYRPTSATISQSLRYEWCNILRQVNSPVEALFQLAQKFEPFKELGTGQTVQDSRVAWNLLGTILLTARKEDLLIACEAYPISAALFARCFHQELVELPDFRRQTSFREFLDRASLIDYSATTFALRSLKNHSDHPDEMKELTTYLETSRVDESQMDPL